MIDYTALTPLVERVASAVHASFPLHHDVNDTKQHLWLWVFENKNTVADIVRNTERPEGNLYSLMTKEANKFLKKEDAVSHGYSQEDVFNYPTAVVEELLSTVFDYEDWQSFGQRGDGQPTAKGQANMTGDRIAMLVDVKSAVERLNTDQYNAILWTYKYHFTPADLGEALGISEDAARKRVSRAAGAVRKLLGTKSLSDLRNGYNSRTAAAVTKGKIGAAEARYVTERNYEG